MPNWCENILEVSGEKEVLDRFRKETGYAHKDFRFQNIIPVKPDGTIDDHIAAWGTKWDIDGKYEVMYESDNYLSLSFMTAWSPPDCVVRELIRRYPELSFTLNFIEPGCRFAGYIYGENGMVTEYVTEEEDEFRYMAIEKFGYDPELFEEDCC